MKKIVRLTETDLIRLVKRVILEKEEDDEDENKPDSNRTEFKVGDRVYVVGMDDIPGTVVGFDKDKYGNPLVVVRIAGTKKGYLESDVYKLGDKDLGSWSLSRPRLTEDHENDDYENDDYEEYEITAEDEINGQLCKDFNVSDLIVGDIIYRRLIDVDSYTKQWARDVEKLSPRGLASYDRPIDYEVVGFGDNTIKLK